IDRPRNYIRVNNVTPGKDADRGDFPETLSLPRRLRPRSVGSFGYQRPKFDASPYTHRKAVGEPFVTEVLPGKWLIVQALAPTVEEMDAKRIADEDAGAPASDPKPANSLVVAISEGEVRATELDSFSPYWQDSH